MMRAWLSQSGICPSGVSSRLVPAGLGRLSLCTLTSMPGFQTPPRGWIEAQFYEFCVCWAAMGGAGSNSGSSGMMIQAMG